MRNEQTIGRLLQTARRPARRLELEQQARELSVAPATLVQFIKQNQKPDKRYPSSAPRHLSTVAKRAAVQALLEKTIGVTAAGWCAAATSLGVAFPEWVGRWKSRNNGTVVFRSSGNVVEFKAKNPNRHTDSATIQRALNAAYDRQAEAMRRSLVTAIARGVFQRQDVFGR